MNAIYLHGTVEAKRGVKGGTVFTIRTKKPWEARGIKREAQSKVDIHFYGSASEHAETHGVGPGDSLIVQAHFDDEKLVCEWYNVLADLREGEP